MNIDFLKLKVGARNHILIKYYVIGTFENCI